MLLLLIIPSYNSTEGFMSDKEIKLKTRDLYRKKSVFKPGTTYGQVRQSFPWIDPVIYDDVYKESLKNKLSYSNLEKIFE
jgi:hypothetical protein